MMAVVFDYLRAHYWLSVAIPGGVIAVTAVVFWGMK